MFPLAPAVVAFAFLAWILSSRFISCDTRISDWVHAHPRAFLPLSPLCAHFHIPAMPLFWLQCDTDRNCKVEKKYRNWKRREHNNWQILLLFRMQVSFVRRNISNFVSRRYCRHARAARESHYSDINVVRFDKDLYVVAMFPNSY